MPTKIRQFIHKHKILGLFTLYFNELFVHLHVYYNARYITMIIIHQYKKPLLVLLFLTGFFFASAKEKDYVLLLNSINMEEAWVKNFCNTLEARFNEQNTLDLKTFPLFVPLLKTQEEVVLLHKKILEKFPLPPKAVFIVGDPGWITCSALFDGPWKDMPVILCYSRERIPSTLQTLLDKVPLTERNSVPISEFNKNYNITVLKQPYFIPQTLKLIQHLQPKVKKIALISDERYISVVTRQSIQTCINNDFPNLKLEALSSGYLSTEQLLDTLSTYDQSTGVIYYSWFRQYGSNNNVYLSDHIRKILPTFLKVPVYMLADLNLHKNLFAGGHYISVNDFTNTAMSVLNRILSGEPASSIPYQNGGTPRTYLNYADLQWCNIPEALYPANAVYFFKPPTFYQRYKISIWITCIFLMILFAVYILYQLRSQKNKKELIKAKERAEEADQLKSAFLANMSHEIRTPLNAIVGFSSILAESADTEESREYSKIIESNNYLLLQLINDILDLSRIEAGLLEFSYSNEDANHCLQELKDAFCLRMPENVEFIISPAQEKCIIYMEKSRVIQVLGNYISNAIKYTTQGSITIGYYPPGNGKIRFFVRDTGCGIPAGKHKDVFERFVKLNNFKQGTGLGLSICRMIAEKMHATVGVSSETGKGAEFWLEIPYQPTEK